MRLLLVEDNLTFAEVLSTALEESGYIVDVVHDGEAGWHQVSIEEYGIILLDNMLPKMDGVSLCQRLRAQGYNNPIIMLTARDSTMDKVISLDAGVDDYLVKPIDFPELMARLRALQRRGPMSYSTTLNWEHLTLHPTNHEVMYEHKSIPLTPTEFSLLELFLHSKQRVLSRPFIVSQLWDLADPPGQGTVKAHLKGLRKKLKQAGAPSDFIQTVRGIGYRLKAIP